MSLKQIKEKSILEPITNGICFQRVNCCPYLVEGVCIRFATCAIFHTNNYDLINLLFPHSANFFSFTLNVHCNKFLFTTLSLSVTTLIWFDSQSESVLYVKTKNQPAVSRVRALAPNQRDWQRANARNTSFLTIYHSQFMLSTQLIITNYPVILSHQCNTSKAITPFIHIYNTFGLEGLVLSVLPAELSDGCTSAWQLKHHILKSWSCKHKWWLVSCRPQKTVIKYLVVSWKWKAWLWGMW